MDLQVDFDVCPNSANSILLSSVNPYDLAALAIMEPTEEIRGVNLICLLESGKFSDLQVSCEGGDFAVHMAILCAQSRVISAACEGNFEVRSVVDE